MSDLREEVDEVPFSRTDLENAKRLGTDEVFPVRIAYSRRYFWSRRSNYLIQPREFAIKSCVTSRERFPSVRGRRAAKLVGKTFF
jgi:hypothetical protein